jgi:hypothetical protein
MSDNATISMERAVWAGHAAAAMKKARNCRYYSATPADLLALGALMRAWQEGRDKSFTREEAAELLESLAPYCESLFQIRPSDEPEPIAADLEQFKDEFGALPKNPWTKESINLTDQSFITKNYPALATYLKTVAEKGETFMAVAKRKADRAARQQMRDLEYTEKEHRENPFRNPDTTLTARMAFEKAVGEPITQFYKREATESIQLPWLGKPNMTTMQRMQRENPNLRAVVDRSGEMLREWATQELTEAESVAAAALERQETAKALLQSKIKEMESALETK